MKKKEKGITLVALIITIIVMLILVAVTITVALNGGLFRNAKDASEQTKKESDKEVLLSAVSGTIDSNGDFELTKEKLDAQLEANWKVIDNEETDSENKTLTCTNTDNNKSYIIDKETGKISETNSNSGAGVTTNSNPVVIVKSSMEEVEITSSNIQDLIGTEVVYQPAGDSSGVYRIFYLDTTGKYGDGENTLYLKRDYDANLTYTVSADCQNQATNEEKEIMKKMNPLWMEKDGIIDSSNERTIAALYNVTTYSTYCDTSKAKYAIGSPSIEMYVDAYNQWKGTTNSLNYKFVETEYGYSVGANGEYSNNGEYTNDNTVQSGPNNIFAESMKSWWIISPSRVGENRVLVIDGALHILNHALNVTRPLCPIVALKNS